MSKKVAPTYREWAESMEGRDLEPTDWALKMANPAGDRFLLNELLREAWESGKRAGMAKAIG